MIFEADLRKFLTRKMKTCLAVEYRIKVTVLFLQMRTRDSPVCLYSEIIVKSCAIVETRAIFL